MLMFQKLFLISHDLSYKIAQLIITAGEDCTCRVWDHDGRELNEIKEHM